MKIVSFNVNGLRSRLHQLSKVLETHRPALVGLQETKVEDAAFPREAIRSLGYEALHHGQKGHYGVALLHQTPPLSTQLGFPEDGEEAQCRLVGATFATAAGPLVVYNCYAPQGEGRHHPVKFPAKREFFHRLRQHLEAHHDPQEALVVMGDLNVAPLDKDVGIGEENRKRWLRTGKSGFLPEEREWLQHLMGFGLVDAYEALHPEPGEQRYSWFDYRSRGFEREPKRGLRIDLILVTRPLLARLRGAGIDQAIRGGERPSDHCPVWVELAL